MSPPSLWDVAINVASVCKRECKKAGTEGSQLQATRGKTRGVCVQRWERADQERESVGDDLNATLILALSDDIGVAHMDIGGEQQ